MSEWRHFVHVCRFSAWTDILVLVVTFVLTVAFDLVVAIAAGLILATVLFMKRMADVASVRRWEPADEHAHGKVLPAGAVVYELNGPLFFADADKMISITPEEGLRVLILRMSNMPLLDASALKNLSTLLYVCRSRGTVLLLSHVSPQPLSVMKKAGFLEDVGEEHVFASIDDALAYAEALSVETIHN